MKLPLRPWFVCCAILLASSVAGSDGLIALPVLAQDSTDTRQFDPNSPQAEGDRLFQSGQELRESGEFAAALAAFETALAIYEGVGDRSAQINTLNHIGNVYLDMGQHDQAADFYQQALAIDPDSATTADATDAIGVGPGTSDVSEPNWLIPDSSQGIGEETQPDGAIAFQPPETARASQSSPGASRGSLLSWANGNRPTALVSDSQTVAAHPTVFIYLPEFEHLDGSDAVLGFALEDEVGNVYEIGAPVPSTGGILGISFEDGDNIPPLDINQQYQWQIWIGLDPDRFDAFDLVATGWIERVEPGSLDRSPADIPLAERPYAYRDAGLWYDAVTALFELRQTDPNDATTHASLQELFDWVGLENVTPDDFIGYWSDLEPPGPPVTESPSPSESATELDFGGTSNSGGSGYSPSPNIGPLDRRAPGGAR